MFIDIGNWYRFKITNILSFVFEKLNSIRTYWNFGYFSYKYITFSIHINDNNITCVLFMQCKHLLIGRMTANIVHQYWISLYKYMTFSHLFIFVYLCRFKLMWIVTLHGEVRRHYRRVISLFSLCGDQKYWSHGFSLSGKNLYP